MELQGSNWVKPIKTDPMKDAKTAGDATETKEEKEDTSSVATSPLAISLEEKTAGEAEAG